MPEACGTSRREVLIFALLTAACVAADAMLYVTLPVFWREAGLDSLWEVGVVLALNRLARLPLNPLIGWAYTRLNTKTCAAFAALLSALIPVGYAFASSLAAWAALRVLWGLAWSLLKLGGLFTVMAAAGQKNRGYFMGLFTGTYRLGNLAGMLGGGLLADPCRTARRPARRRGCGRPSPARGAFSAEGRATLSAQKQKRRRFSQSPAALAGNFLGACHLHGGHAHHRGVFHVHAVRAHGPSLGRKHHRARRHGGMRHGRGRDAVAALGLGSAALAARGTPLRRPPRPRDHVCRRMLDSRRTVFCSSAFRCPSARGLPRLRPWSCAAPP